MVDRDTVKVELNFPAPAFLPLLAVDYMKIVPRHVRGRLGEDRRTVKAEVDPALLEALRAATSGRSDDAVRPLPGR